MLLDLHRRDEALAAFEKALELNADHLGALFGKGASKRVNQYKFF